MIDGNEFFIDLNMIASNFSDMNNCEASGINCLSLSSSRNEALLRYQVGSLLTGLEDLLEEVWMIRYTLDYSLSEKSKDS